MPAKDAGILTFMTYSRVSNVTDKSPFWVLTIKVPHLNTEEAQLLLVELKKVFGGQRVQTFALDFGIAVSSTRIFQKRLRIVVTNTESNSYGREYDKTPYSRYLTSINRFTLKPSLAS
jgi:hypothetical protein